ncbi:MAG: MOSC domain-containing protein [Gemmatimonadaceae bacterium]
MTLRAGRIVSLNRSSGGVPKLEVDEAVISTDGMTGDTQHDRRHHGGADRAVSLYSLDLIEQLQLEGHPIAPGTAGENVTVAGIEWREVMPGRHMSIGAVEIEVTSFASPCTTIRGSFLEEEFTRISHKVHPGWSRVYARVVTPGVVRVGDAVLLMNPSFTTLAS